MTMVPDKVLGGETKQSTCILTLKATLFVRYHLPSEKTVSLSTEVDILNYILSLLILLKKTSVYLVCVRNSNTIIVTIILNSYL